MKPLFAIFALSKTPIKIYNSNNDTYLLLWIFHPGFFFSIEYYHIAQNNLFNVWSLQVRLPFGRWNSRSSDARRATQYWDGFDWPSEETSAAQRSGSPVRGHVNSMDVRPLASFSKYHRPNPALPWYIKFRSARTVYAWIVFIYKLHLQMPWCCRRQATADTFWFTRFTPLYVSSTNICGVF